MDTSSSLNKWKNKLDTLLKNYDIEVEAIIPEEDHLFNRKPGFPGSTRLKFISFTIKLSVL